MIRLTKLLPFFLAVFVSATVGFPQKESLDKSILSRSDASWDAAMKIWQWAEPGYQETKSSALLADILEKAGFTIARGVAEIPTAFTATYGEGRPVIGILGEFDALPGLSQQAVPRKAPREDANNYGHGCGHHLFGVASASAAIALAEQIKAGQIKGTVRFYGTPAEEGGSGKTFMVRAGLFDDCDAVLHWHPASRNAAGDPTDMARIAVKFRFRGKSAHAASAPEQGRSALDAAELTAFASEMLREHTPDFTRIHHVITNGGGAPNVVPDFAEMMYYVRHPDVNTARSVYDRLVLCAQAGALATETKLEIEYLGGTYNMLPNSALTAVTIENLRRLSDLHFSPDEIEFSKEIQKTLAEPRPLDDLNGVLNAAGTVGKGSTDVGDVSWVAPTSGFTTLCWVPGTPAHSWQAAAAGATNIGKQGMLLAARVLAATAWDLYHQPDTLAAARAELSNRRSKTEYKPLLEPGQKPPLDYRSAGNGRPSE